MNNRIIEQLKEVGITSYDDSLYPRIYVYGELGKESNTSTYFTINEGNSISIAGETDNTFIRLKELLDWDEWNQAISDGRAKLIDKATKTGKLLPAYEMDATSYQIPNPDLPDLVNTIQKMAQKRAIVGSVLIATNASGFFTQDVEDMDIPITNGRQHRGQVVSDEGEIMDGEFTPVSVPEPEPESVPEIVLTSDGTPYDELPTDQLSARFNAMQKKLKDNGLTDEQKAEYEKKIKEAQRILAKRRSYADSGN